MPVGVVRPRAPRFESRLKRGVCAASALLASTAPAALAQQMPPPPDQITPAAADAPSNITSYKPDFFNQFRPNTAMDMIGRIPGFSFDGGTFARGFSGTAGN